MKITDIITESLDAKVHKMITDMNRGMTVDQFIELTSHDHQVEIDYTQVEDSDKFYVKTASMNMFRDSSGPEDKVMRFVITGPDAQLDPSTPVKELERFIGIYKHEMAHFYQQKSENGNADKLHNEYINASAERWIEYFVQAKERPAMIVNVSESLAELNMSPAEFFKHIGQANGIVSSQFERFANAHDVRGEMKAEWDSIDPGANEAFDVMVKRMGKFLTGNYATSLGGESNGLFRVLRTYTFYLNYYNLQGENDRADKLKAQFNAFKRLLLNKSKQTLAYKRDAEKQ